MIRREIAIFLVVGSLTVLLDFLSYRGLVWTQLLGVDGAKAIGFIIGTVFAYFANRFWTFGYQPHEGKSVWRFVVLYTATLCTNVYINSLILILLIDFESSIQLAFLVATGVSAILNLIGMKFFVFK